MNISFARVNALPIPAERAASTLYLVAHPTDVNYAAAYLTNNDGTATRRLPTLEDIKALIPEIAGTADSLTTARNISTTGDATWSVSFKGDADVSGALTLAATGVVAGDFFKVTVDAKGRVTGGSNPTTLAGFGITDAAAKSVVDTHIADGTLHLGAGQRALLDAINASAAEINNLVGVTSPLQTQLNGKQASLGFTAENAANKGVANGYAPLNGAGQVPAANLPSYVDEVQEFDNKNVFPAEGIQDIIYVARDDNKIYRWTGSTYLHINSSVGQADTADTLTTARNISISGDATWTVSFNGSADVSGVLTLANTGVVAGTYAKVAVDAKGRVTGSAALVAGDIPSLDSTTVTSSAAVALVSNEW